MPFELLEVRVAPGGRACVASVGVPRPEDEAHASAHVGGERREDARELDGAGVARGVVKGAEPPAVDVSRHHYEVLVRAADLGRDDGNFRPAAFDAGRKPCGQRAARLGEAGPEASAVPKGKACDGNADIVVQGFGRGRAPDARDDHVVDLLARDEDDACGAPVLKGAHDGLHCQTVRENDPAGDLFGGCRPGSVDRDVDKIRLEAICGRRHGVSEYFISNAARFEGCAFGRADVAWKRLARHAATRVREELFQNVEGTDFRLV